MTAHTCDYSDGLCSLDGVHGGVPDPDPSLAKVEDFAVRGDSDGGTSLVCAHYGRGCWWETSFGSPWEHDTPGDTLGDLLDAAREHLAKGHRSTVAGSVVPPV
jgi:hypothetical protein